MRYQQRHGDIGPSLSESRGLFVQRPDGFVSACLASRYAISQLFREAALVSEIDGHQTIGPAGITPVGDNRARKQLFYV